MAIVSVALPEESRLLHTLGLLASGLARQPVAVQALARAPASAPAPGQAHALPPRAVLISQPARLLVPANLPMQAHLHAATTRSEEHTSELQSQSNLVCRLLLEK